MQQRGFSAWSPSLASSPLAPESRSPSLSRREASCQSHRRSGRASVGGGGGSLREAGCLGVLVLGVARARDGKGDSAPRRSPGLVYRAPPQNVGNYPRRGGDGRRTWDRTAAAWKIPGGGEVGPVSPAPHPAPGLGPVSMSLLSFRGERYLGTRNRVPGELRLRGFAVPRPLQGAELSSTHTHSHSPKSMTYLSI